MSEHSGRVDGEPARPRRLGRALAAAALGLALLEGILRVAVPAETRHHVWPPGASRLLRPDPRYTPGVSGDAHFTVDTQGLRGKELGPDAELRLLALGDGATECLYLDDADTWPAIVGGALEQKAEGRPVWIGNAGKAGALSRDHVVQLEHLAAELPRLDAVLVLAGVGDLGAALAQGDDYLPPPPITDPEAARREVRRAFAVAPGRLQDLATDAQGAVNAPFYQRTALYQLIARARRAGQLGGRGPVEDDVGEVYATWREHRAHPGEMRLAAPDLTAPLAEYRRNLGVMADLAAARGVRLVLLTQPTLWRADLPAEAMALLWLGGVGSFQAHAGKPYYSVPALAGAIHRYNETLLDVCRERGLACLDLASKIPRDATMFYDDWHFTEAGARAVATLVARHLRRFPPFTEAVQ